MRPCPTVAVLLLAVPPAFAAPPPAAALADKVDERLAASWKHAGVQPAPLVDDATFARRVYLDLVGRVPTASELRSFTSDRSPARRAALVDRLLGSGSHRRHAATFWRRVWVPQADTPEFGWLADDFEDWLADRLAARTPYDRLVREVLVSPPGRLPRGAARDATTPSRTFYTASEYQPANLAANAARAFLGINLDCAQCHDHPFARWTRAQFWETAAFFNPVGAGGAGPARFEIGIPGASKLVRAGAISEPAVRWPAGARAGSGAEALAAWLTDRANPYFAKNAVNRVWADLFGTGLIEPLDDLGRTDASSHPELLDDLSSAFVASGYDLEYLTRALALTRAYQRSSATPPGGGAEQARLFARMPVRGLSGEQLYDSLRVAAGLPAVRDDLEPEEARRERRLFAARFYTERAAAAQRSVLQALALMNGGVTGSLTDPGVTPALAAANAPFLQTADKVETLFLTTLARAPSRKELDACVRYVESGGSHPGRDRARALADVFWALINGSEFSTNH